MSAGVKKLEVFLVQYLQNEKWWKARISWFSDDFMGDKNWFSQISSILEGKLGDDP